MMFSKSIDRYNDDFYLNWDGSQSNLDMTSMPQISKLNDWSICFFDIRNENGSGGANNQPITGNRAGSLEGLSVVTRSIGGFYSVRLFVYDGTANAFTLNTSIPTGVVSRGYFVCLKYKASNNSLVMEVNKSDNRTFDLSGINDWGSATNFKLGSRGSTSGNWDKLGGVRDLLFLSKEISAKESDYIYKTSTIPISAYDEVIHYYPLNQIPKEVLGDYFMEDKASLYNPATIDVDIQLIGWSGVDLGIPLNTTASAYRDWASKTNYIPSDVYSKGLNFDSSKQQYLEVTGLEAFGSGTGYTFLSGVQMDSLVDGQQTHFSADGNNGSLRLYDLFRRSSGNDFVLHTHNGTVANEIRTIQIPSIINVLKNNFISTYVGSDRYVPPYSSVVTNITKIVDVNCQQKYIGAISDQPIANIGFSSIVDPIFRLGARSSSTYLNGKISFFSIIKGSITKEEEKRMFNNGLYRSPSEVLSGTSRIIIDVDFTNPFQDGLDIKFPDNSGNCQIIARQNIGTDWDTLLGVQNSID